MKQKHIEPEPVLPKLLKGSEYKYDDPGSCREANLLGQAIAIVVHAEKNNVKETDKKRLLKAFEAEYEQVKQFKQKESEFNRQHPTRPEHLQPHYSSDFTLNYRNWIQQWLEKALWEAIDWHGLYDLIEDQMSYRGHTDWWEKVKSVCRRAETTIGSFDVVSEIRKISEEFGAEKPAETGQNAVYAKLRKIWMCIKRIPRWIYVLVIFLSALLGVLNHLGWLEPIKEFIYNNLRHK